MPPVNPTSTRGSRANQARGDSHANQQRVTDPAGNEEPRYPGPGLGDDTHRLTHISDNEGDSDDYDDDDDDVEGEYDDGDGNVDVPEARRMYHVASRRSSTATLSQVGHLFARDVGVGNIPGCAKFMNTHPDVLQEQNTDHKYVKEAIAARKSIAAGSYELAESYVEKGLLVRKCSGKSTREITEYLQPLAKNDDAAWRLFNRDFNATMDYVKKCARESAQEPTESLPASMKGMKLSEGTRHAFAGQVNPRPQRLMRGLTNQYYHPQTSSNAPHSGQPERHAPPINDRTEQGYHPNPDRPRRGSVIKRGGRPGQNTQPNDGSALTDEPEDEQASQFSLGRPPSFRGNAIPRAVAIESRLDSSFKKKKPPEAGAFFVVGRVFKMLWHTEQTGPNTGHPKWTLESGLGTPIYSHIRIFAVVREGHGYCWAVPINTYKGRGVGKPGFNQEDIDAHAIVYTVGYEPKRLRNEPRMRKTPIQVSAADNSSDCVLDEASRINFARVNTIEHNVTVRNVGMVVQSSKVYFQTYWSEHVAK